MSGWGSKLAAWSGVEDARDSLLEVSCYGREWKGGGRGMV